MKGMGRALAFTVAVGIARGLVGLTALGAQEAPVTRQVLEKVDLGEKEGIMYVAEFAPRASTGKHFHSGPETVYVLQGSGILEMEGHPPRAFKAGESFSMPTRHIHEAKNASDSDRWRLLVFLAGEKGQPIVTPVTQP